MRTLRKLTVPGAMLLMLAFSLPSHAVVISSGSNNPLAFSWSFDSNSSVGLLSGFGTLTVSGFNSSSLTVVVTLTNTSLLYQNRLTHFGFGIDPDATGVSFVDASDGGMIGAAMDDLPSLSAVEVCARGGPNCSGGSNGGIYGVGSGSPKSDTFTLLLAGTWGSSVDIDPIGFKYQTDFGSWEFTAPGGSIPEPGPLALFGLGLAGLTLRKRRKVR